MTTMAKIPLYVSRNSDPAKLTIRINWLAATGKQKFREFIHHVAVNHKANSSAFARSKDVDLGMRKLKLR